MNQTSIFGLAIGGSVMIIILIIAAIVMTTSEQKTVVKKIDNSQTNNSNSGNLQTNNSKSKETQPIVQPEPEPKPVIQPIIQPVTQQTNPASKYYPIFSDMISRDELKKLSKLAKLFSNNTLNLENLKVWKNMKIDNKLETNNIRSQKINNLYMDDLYKLVSLKEIGGYINDYNRKSTCLLFKGTVDKFVLPFKVNKTTQSYSNFNFGTRIYLFKGWKLSIWNNFGTMYKTDKAPNLVFENLADDIKVFSSDTYPINMRVFSYRLELI